MKKIIAGLAVILTASVINAASIYWSVGGSTSAVVHDYLNNLYSGTAYLILADNFATDFAGDFTKEEFFSKLDELTLETKTITNGAKPIVQKQTVTDDSLIEGTTQKVGLLIVSEDELGNGYIKAAIANATPFGSTTAEKEKKTSTTAWALDQSATWAKAYSVPEPATGALALAGLALLFRRKRA